MIKWILFGALVAVIFITSSTSADCDDGPKEPPTCRKHEVWNKCANSGSARNCSEFGNPIIGINPEECEGGCICKDGFLRNDKTGFCIPTEKCPEYVCCGNNEVYKRCPVKCPPQECGVNPAATLCLRIPGPPECDPSCVCKDGYVRNDKRKCVLPENCPKCDKPNERYEWCPKTCPPQTCESLKPGTVYACPAMSEPPVCQGQCMCIPGFYRNEYKVCISEEDCKKCSDE